MNEKKNKKEKEKTEEKEKEQEEQTETEGEEVELKEESLEKLTEQPEPMPEESDFSEFMFSSGTGERPTSPPPTLFPLSEAPPLPEAEPTENLEEIGQEAPAQPPAPAEPETEKDYVTVSNEPKYTAGTSEEQIIRGMRRRGMTADSVEQLRAVKPRVVMEEWREVGEPVERGIGDDLKDYTVTDVEVREEERGLPFEKQRKYKGLKE